MEKSMLDPQSVSHRADISGVATAGPAQPLVKHFRQIVMWPLQLLSADDTPAGYLYETLMDGSAETGPWRLLADEFGGPDHEFHERHYREFVSFLPHVQRFLYGDPPSPAGASRPGDIPLRVYRRDDVSGVRVILRDGDIPMLCDVAHVDLYFFYDIDAVILVTEISTNDIRLDDAKALMQRFGRAYPSGWRQDSTPVNCPTTVEWLDAQGNVLAASDYRNRERYLRFVGDRRATCVSKHWEFILSPIVCDAGHDSGPLRFREIEYDRMPVLTYLVLEDLSVLQREDYISLALATKLQTGTALPFSERFLQNFDAEHVYERLYSSGLDAPDIDTRFLTSGDSFAIVAGGGETSLLDNERGLLGQVRHQYFLLFLIAHFHKAALLMLSDRTVAAIKRLEPRNSASVLTFRDETFRLQESFLRFSQRYLFKEISGRAHIRDLFRMVRTHLRIDALYDEVRGEIFDMVQYLDSNALRRQSTSIYRLTVVTIFGLVGTIVTGFLGMNLIAEAEAPLSSKLTYFALVTFGVTALTAVAVIYSRRLTNFLERISGDDKRI